MARQRPRTSAEKRAGLDREMRAGSEVHALVNHPAVVAFFDAKQRQWTSAMIACAPGDDAGRRAIALKLQSYLELKQEIGVLIGSGLAAEKQLANMKDDDDD